MSLPQLTDPSLWSNPASFGIFPEVPNRDYHAAPGVSSSHLKRLAVSPAYAKLPVEFSAIAQRSIDIGTLAHGFALDNLTPEQMGFALKPDGMSFASKDGKAWREANPGPLVDSDQIATARAVEAAIFADPDAREVASRRGKSELSLRAACQDTGLTLKARFDYFEDATVAKDGVARIWDIKTTGKGVSPDAFAKVAEDSGYLLQAAHYLHVAKLLGIEVGAFRFVAASTEAPHEVACYDFGPEHPAWEKVNEHLFGLYELHAACAERGDWPKTPWGVRDIGLPSWSRYGARKELFNG